MTYRVSQTTPLGIGRTWFDITPKRCEATTARATRCKFRAIFLWQRFDGFGSRTAQAFFCKIHAANPGGNQIWS